MWTTQFELGTSSKNYYASEVSGNLSIGAGHATRRWSLSFERGKKTFILIHFKPYLVYSGPLITFNSTIYLNGAACSWKSTQIATMSGAPHDTVCAFVADAGVSYEISLNFNNNPSTTSYWTDVGQPLLTFVEL